MTAGKRGHKDRWLEVAKWQTNDPFSALHSPPLRFSSVQHDFFFFFQFEESRDDFPSALTGYCLVETQPRNAGAGALLAVDVKIVWRKDQEAHFGHETVIWKTLGVQLLLNTFKWKTDAFWTAQKNKTVDVAPRKCFHCEKLSQNYSTMLCGIDNKDALMAFRTHPFSFSGCFPHYYLFDLQIRSREFVGNVSAGQESFNFQSV